MTVKTSFANASAALAARLSRVNGGSVQIRTGAAPATAEAAASGTLLATLTLSATAFGAPANVGGNAQATANTITGDTSADATGTAGHFRVMASDGTTCEWVGTIGTSGADMNMVTTSITAGQPVDITSWTCTEPT